MNKSIRKRFIYLVLLILFVASFAFAYEFFLPVSPAYIKNSSPPDTIITPQTPSSDSIYQSLLSSIASMYSQQRYEECLVVLKKANALKPDVPSVQERIIRVEGLIDQQKKTQAEYSKMITLADGYFEKKDYLNAKSSYQLAIDIKPDDPVAREKMKRTMELLRSHKAQNILYDVTLASADKLYIAGELDKARREYEKALKIMPEAAYPKEKINAIIKTLVDQQVRDELYMEAVTTADRYYNSRSFKRALLEYKKALEQKPAEPYPLGRVDELTKILADIAALEEAYQKAITLGDQLFEETRYSEARSEYTEALGLKPEEIYPAEKIRRIDEILARITKTDTDFETMVNLADSFYIARNFSDARRHYQLALNIKPNEAYPKAMLTKTMAGVSVQEANELALEERYKSAITNADKLFAEELLTEAKTAYEGALFIKPQEVYPQQKISEIETLMEAAIAQQREIDIQYTRILENADRMFSDKLYPQSMEQYQAALKLKPEEAYPAQKIDEINGLFADREALEIRYAELIAAADEKLNLLEYQNAKEGYQEAVGLKPKETYPAAKIREIDIILATMTREEKLEADYASALASGDSLLASEAYQQAKVSFISALALKPNETYPALKITEIDTILAERARLQTMNQQYDEAIASGDQLFAGSKWQQAREAYLQAQGLRPRETYPPKQIAAIDIKLEEIAQLKALDKEYNDVVASAEKQFAAKVWDSARITFTAAQTLKPAESLPGLRISQIDSILATLADQQILDEQYAALITSSDKLLAGEDYTNARAGYSQALALKPTESYPSDKVAEIDGIVAENTRIAALELQYSGAISRGDSLMSADMLIPARGEFEVASGLKPDEEYPKTKLAEIEVALQEIASQMALDERYQQEVASADKLFYEKSWDPAITGYQRALKLKPAEEYPTARINQIDSIRQEIARQLALDQEYQETISKGERQLSGNIYDSARTTFTAAQSLKPAESLPGLRIAQIDSILAAITDQQVLDEQYAALISSSNKLLADQDYTNARDGYSQALGLKPTESYPADKITEIDEIIAENARIAELELEYTQAVTRGDSLMSADLLTAARGEFETASALKPQEEYPKTKLGEIDLALQDIARLQALEKRYQEEVATGERLFTDKSWDPAIAAFERAQELKPSEQYPGQKIHQIDSIRQEITRQLQIDKDYGSMIASADNLLRDRSLDSARTEYTKAGELRPEKIYWQDQIVEIDRILAEIKRVNDEYQAAITNADALLVEKSYEEARAAYQDASLIKTKQSYPREKIKEINGILADIQGRRQTFDKLVANGDLFLSLKEYYKARDNFQQALDLFPVEEHPKEQLRVTNVRIDSIYRANKADYDKAVGEGDGFFNTYEYDKAIDAFTRAITFLPMEDYPRQMIAKIRKTISENAIADVLSTPVIIKEGAEQKFPFEPVNIASRRNNFIYMKVKNLSDKSFNILMRYGKGDQTSGGLAIRNVSTNGEVNERLISVKDQDPWYREDNNWISIYPQGGDIEVSFIQVSRAIN